MTPRNICLTICLVFTAACANPYRANFNSTGDRLPKWFADRLAPPSRNPQLLTSNDIQAENWKLFEKGFIMVGFSKFDGESIDTNLALKQAHKIGADVVVVEKKYTKTLTETVTATHWLPDETTEIREDAFVSGGKIPKQVSKRTEISTRRGPETVYLPKETDYFEHSATYWRKIRNPIFGAFVEGLSDSQKQALETNHGLVVRAIIVDSPAHEADLLKGDIITKVDGNPAPSQNKFYEQIVGRAGKKITLTILRGQKYFDRAVTLNL